MHDGDGRRMARASRACAPGESCCVHLGCTCCIGQRVRIGPTPPPHCCCSWCSWCCPARHSPARSCVPLLLCSGTTPGSCEKCASHSYTDTAGHREAQCFTQATCDKGKFLSGPSPTTRGTCKPCPRLHYLENDGHRQLRCNRQPSCSNGKFLNGASVTTKGACSSCRAGTYQTMNSQNEAVCMPQVCLCPSMHACMAAMSRGGGNESRRHALWRVHMLQTSVPVCIHARRHETPPCA